MTWVTEVSTVAADAPGYSAKMATDGGAIVGYCSIGRVRMASAPATMITIAMTVAKIGRSMKKRDSNAGLPDVVGGDGADLRSSFG